MLTMSKIFICHASEDKEIADAIHLALKSDEHDVFFDDTSLKETADYNNKIISAIKGCDLFVFLISKNSIRKKKYALSELKIAQKKWETPNHHILPINIDNTPLDLIPPYLKATTILNPTGDVVIETKVAASNLLKGRRTIKIIKIAAKISLITTIVAAATYLINIDEITYKLLDCRFGGRVGQAEIINNALYPLEIKYYHPNNHKEYIRFFVNGQSSHTEQFNIGEDWGIKIGSRRVQCLATASEWKDKKFIVFTDK